MKSMKFPYYITVAVVGLIWLCMNHYTAIQDRDSLSHRCDSLSQQTKAHQTWADSMRSLNDSLQWELRMIDSLYHRHTSNSIRPLITVMRVVNQEAGIHRRKHPKPIARCHAISE